MREARRPPGFPLIVNPLQEGELTFCGWSTYTAARSAQPLRSAVSWLRQQADRTCTENKKPATIPPDAPMTPNPICASIVCWIAIAVTSATHERP